MLPTLLLSGWLASFYIVPEGLADLVGVTAATMLAMSWTHLRAPLIQAQRGEAEALGAYERRLLTRSSAMDVPLPPSSGITIHAHR